MPFREAEDEGRQEGTSVPEDARPADGRPEDELLAGLRRPVEERTIRRPSRDNSKIRIPVESPFLAHRT